MGVSYKAMAVEGDSLHYYETLWDYIHLNPSRAGLVDATRGQSVLDYPWSSLVGGYGVLAPQRPPWLAATRSLAILGVEDSVEGRRALIERLDKRAAEERERSGWVTVDPEN
ncbi:transposase, partial [bacterium]|nr:transposase [bacterium]